MPAAITWDKGEVMARVTIDDDGCWIWRNHRPDGYAQVSHRGRTKTAHRFVYELLVGPIPNELPLDHRCHTDDKTCQGGPACKHRACANPEHLEPVTILENHRRSRRYEQTAGKTHCPQDHPYAGWNLIIYDGRRYCRACIYARTNARRNR